MGGRQIQKRKDRDKKRGRTWGRGGGENEISEIDIETEMGKKMEIRGWGWRQMEQKESREISPGQSPQMASLGLPQPPSSDRLGRSLLSICLEAGSHVPQAGLQLTK